MPSAARAPPPRLQGNRGFRLLLWEPEVTVYSHGRPAARPRARHAAHCQPGMGETATRRKRGAAESSSDASAGEAGGAAQGGGLLRALTATQPPRQRRKHGLTVCLSDRPVLLAEVLQPGDGERRGSSGIWVLFISSMGGRLLGPGGKRKSFVFWGLKGVGKVLLNTPHSPRTPS